MVSDGGIGAEADQRTEGGAFCSQFFVDRVHSCRHLKLRNPLFYQAAELEHSSVIQLRCQNHLFFFILVLNAAGAIHTLRCIFERGTGSQLHKFQKKSGGHLFVNPKGFIVIRIPGDDLTARICI